MALRFYRNKRLEDEKIIAALKQAAKDYEDGAIAEAQEVLNEISYAIDEWEADGCN